MNAEADVNMIAIGFFLLIGLAFVGMLILGAALAARNESRTAGFWILGGTLGLAAIVPLVWLLLAFDAGATTVVTNANGQQMQVRRDSASVAPVFWFVAIPVGIGLLVAEVLLLINPRTRTIGYVILGVGLAAFVFLVPASMRQEAPTYVYRSDKPIPYDTGVKGRKSSLLEEKTNAGPSGVTIPAAPLAPEPSTEATAPADAATADAHATPTPVSGATESATGAANVPADSGVAADAVDGMPESVDLAGVKLTAGDKDSLPEWAKQGGGIAADGTYFAVAKSGPYRNFNDCWQRLRPFIDEEVRNYGYRHGDRYGNRWPNRRLPDHLNNQIIAEHYLERGDFSVGEMMTLYTRLEFSKETVAAIDTWQTRLLATNRTIFAGVFGGLIVALIGVLYGYFRIDTATLGYYTWRLRVAAGVLTIAIVLTGFITGAMFLDEEWRLGGEFLSF